MDAISDSEKAGKERSFSILGGHDEFSEHAPASVGKAFYRGDDDGLVNAWADASLENAGGYGNLKEMCANLGSWMFSVPAFLPSVLLHDDWKVSDLMTVTAEIMLMSGYCGPSAGLALTLLVEKSVSRPFIAGLNESDATTDAAGLRMFISRDDDGIILADTPCAYAEFLYEAATSQGLPGAFILETPMKPMLMPPAPGSLPVRRGLLGGKHVLHTPTSSYYDALFRRNSDVKPAGEDTLPMPIHPYILSKVKIRNPAHGGKGKSAHGLGISMPVMRKAYGKDCPWLFDRSTSA